MTGYIEDEVESLVNGMLTIIDNSGDIKNNLVVDAGKSDTLDLAIYKKDTGYFVFGNTQSLVRENSDFLMIRLDSLNNLKKYNNGEFFIKNNVDFYVNENVLLPEFNIKGNIIKIDIISQ